MKILETFLMEDGIYQKDISDARLLQSRYERLNLSNEERMLIDDYIACLNSALCRKCEVAFIIGKALGELKTGF